MTISKDIVGIAAESAKTLAAAINAAGLTHILQGAGPFTVFVPTDEAFALIKKEVDELLKPENKDKLSKLLNYHVVSGSLQAADLKDGQELTTAAGSKLKISITNNQVKVGDAQVTAPDIAATNGMIHVIDKVLMP